MIDAKYGDCGIYKITNIADGKIYVGQSVDLRERGQDHFRKLRQKRHGNPHMQNSFNKYGQDSFKFKVIEECVREDLYKRECFWMSFYQSHIREFGFNIDIPDPERESTGVSDETKKKLRDFNTLYSDEDLLDSLKDFYRENGFVPRIKDLEENPDYPSPRTIKDRFETFNNALEKAGLIDKVKDKSRLKRRLSYTKDEVVHCILEYVFIYQKYPYAKDFDSSNILPSRDALDRLFGGVTEAMHESGYADYEINKKYYTKEDTFLLLDSFIMENNRFPRLDEMKVSNGLVGTNVVQNKFKGLRKMRVEYEEYLKYKVSI